MKSLQATGSLLRASWLTVLVGLAGAAPVSGVVLLNSSGVVTGIDGLQITGGGLDGTFDIRFSGGGLAAALATVPDQLLLYNNPAYSSLTALAVVSSISEVMNAGAHELVWDGFRDAGFFTVPYASVPEPGSTYSYFRYAYNQSLTSTPEWVLGQEIDLSNFFLGPMVLMQPSGTTASAPEPVTFACLSGVLLMVFAGWRHRRTS
jgi:hypothetical protein